MRPASARPSTCSLLDASGARLAVFEEGTPGDTILLLHGGPGVPDYLADVSAMLAARHRVIRFDQRGTGRSPCDSGRYSLDEYIGDVEAVRRAYHLERLSVFGHSWGGMVAQLYAARYPDRVAKLCLSNASVGLGSDWKAMERAVMAHNRRRGGLTGFMRLGRADAKGVARSLENIGKAPSVSRGARFHPNSGLACAARVGHAACGWPRAG